MNKNLSFRSRNRNLYEYLEYILFAILKGLAMLTFFSLKFSIKNFEIQYKFFKMICLKFNVLIRP